MSPMSDTVLSFIRSGEYRAHQDGAPNPYKVEVEGNFRKAILELVCSSSRMNLTTVASDGWPQGHCSRFVAFADESSRPIFYIFARRGEEKLSHIKANPRVSLSIYNAISFEMRRETKAAQIQASAEPVDGDEVWTLAFDAIRQKEGPDYADALVKSTHALIQIDALSVVFFNMMSPPQWGTIDYFADYKKD